MLLLSFLLQVFTMVELNCENLFDCEHDSLREDTEWLPESFRHWNRYRYWQKLNHVGQTLIACGQHGDDWALPDMVVLTEVENDSVMVDLTRRSLLRSARYNYLMTSSSDVRGIDVALLYSPFSFLPLRSASLHVQPVKEMRPTRDILYVCGKLITGDSIHVFALHAPSRYGGERQTRPHRMAVAQRLMESIDSIYETEPDARIIVAGDFNDYDNSASLAYLRSRGLQHVCLGATGRSGVKGTYKYRGIWKSLDHVFCSAPLLPFVTECEIADFPFLLTEDEKYGGTRPKRNYLGAKWQNGYSDHLPLVVRMRLK